MVNFSDKIKDSEKEIKFFLRSKMYNNENVISKNNNGKIIIENLFKKISKNPKKFLSKDEFSKNKYRAISDFISGMTDRYAKNLFPNLKIIHGDVGKCYAYLYNSANLILSNST